MTLALALLLQKEDWLAGGRGFKPQTEPTIKVLK